MSFFTHLRDRITTVDSVLCVGLDTDLDRIPAHLQTTDLPRWAFNRRIIDMTHSYAAAFKLNSAFYEDPDGWRSLIETIAYAHGKNVPVILDAKRADIGATARKYAEHLDVADAITVNPYMGRDSVEPFISRSTAGVFILCRTSNQGGHDIQDRELADGIRVYERVADLAAEWNSNGNIGLVVGATVPEELANIRKRVPELPFLVPGVGAQGGDAEAAIQYGLADGIGLVNASRSIIYHGEGETFDRAAGDAAKQLSRELNSYRTS